MKQYFEMAYSLIRHPNRRERILRRWYILRGQSVPSTLNDYLVSEELHAQATMLKSYPTELYLDPATMCNLACPFCPTGNGSTGIKKELLTMETFNKIVSNLHLDAVKNVYLFNWGEPLLNKHFTDFVKFFHDRGKTTLTSVNFSARDYDDAYMEELVNCGLDTIHVSVDGASQEVYSKYRVKGEFTRVIGNMRRLNEAKKRLGRSNPTMNYKLLLNKFNEPELEEAKKIAQEVGAEFLLHEHFWVPEELRDEWVADAYRQKYGALPVTSTAREDGEMRRRGDEIHTECRQLWDSVLVNANGDVYPCCIVQHADHRVGNLTEQSFDEIWNNEKMQNLRRYVTDTSAPAPNFPNRCVGCASRYCTHDIQQESAARVEHSLV